MLHYSKVYTIKPLFNNLWILTFCMLMIVTLRELGFKNIMVFNKVINPFILNSFYGGSAILRE